MNCRSKSRPSLSRVNWNIPLSLKESPDLRKVISVQQQQTNWQVEQQFADVHSSWLQAFKRCSSKYSKPQSMSENLRFHVSVYFGVLKLTGPHCKCIIVMSMSMHSPVRQNSPSQIIDDKEETYGTTNSWTLLMNCFPTMMMKSCWASSMRQPPGPHYSGKAHTADMDTTQQRVSETIFKAGMRNVIIISHLQVNHGLTSSFLMPNNLP